MRKLVLLVCTILSFSSFAIPPSDNSCFAGGCFNSYIDEIYLRESGEHIVQTSGDETKLNCTPVSNEFVSIGGSSENKRDILSLLLAAQLAGKKVDLRVIEGSANCAIAYVRLKRQ